MPPYLYPLCLITFLSLAPDALAQDDALWKGTLEVGDQSLRIELHLRGDADSLTGELKSLDQGNLTFALSEITRTDQVLSFSVPSINAEFSGTIGPANQATGTFTQAGKAIPLRLTKSIAEEQQPRETLQEVWVGKLELDMMQPVMQFRIVAMENGETKAYFDSVTEGRTGFSGTWSKDDGTLAFEIPVIKLNFTGALNDAGDIAKGTWRQGGREIPLTLTKHTIAYTAQTTWESRPQRPQPPFPYDAQEVSFTNTADQVTLAATLTIPKAPGPHPAVVLISGSGPQDRDESLMQHKPFLVLADHLSRRGIAVLRYDDRGTASSTGDYASATIEDFARDTSAAVGFLSSRDRIDGARIGLAGHSEGGLVAPMVAKARGDIAFIVLLAAPGVAGRRVLQSQTEAMLRAAGTPEEEIRFTLAVNHAVMEVVADETAARREDGIIQAAEAIIQTLPEGERDRADSLIRDQLQGSMKRLQSPWMRHFLNYDPAPALRILRCPVLAINGGKDLQVLPKLNLAAIEAALSDNPHATIIELEGLNHLFQACQTGLMPEYADIDETFNPKALMTITDWILAL